MIQQYGRSANRTWRTFQLESGATLDPPPAANHLAVTAGGRVGNQVPAEVASAMWAAAFPWNHTLLNTDSLERELEKQIEFK